MKSKTVLMVGCGDIGTRVGLELLSRGVRVAAVRRNVSKLPVEFEAYSADYSAEGSLDFIAELQPDVVVTTFNPFDRSEAGYRRGFLMGMTNLLSALKSCPSAQVVMASSTRVYAERDGGWVEDHSALTEDDPWAKAIIEAENALLAYRWTGNVRELKNSIERATLIGKGPELRVEDFGIEGTHKPETPKQAGTEFSFPSLIDTGIDLSSVQEALEKHYIIHALEIANGNESRAARLLNMNHHTFRYRKKKLQIE